MGGLNSVGMMKAYFKSELIWHTNTARFHMKQRNTTKQVLMDLHWCRATG